MKRAAAVLICFVLLAGLFSACRRNTVSALYFSVPGKAAGFDPQIAAGEAVRVVVRNCFEGLVYLDETGAPMPAAAERWTVSPDGLEYTFTLRQGAKWHISETAKSGLEEKLPRDFAPEVTAADFVFALQRAVNPDTGAPDAALLSNISGAAQIMAGEAAASTLGVRAQGKYTLIITLEKPEPGFLEALAEPVSMPCNKTFFDATGGRYGLLMKYIISNGPFYLTRFEDTAFRMARNPDYTGRYTAEADVIWLYGDETEAAVLEAIAEKDENGAYLTERTALSAGIRKAEVLGAQDVLRGFLFNCKNEDLADENVRKAFFAAAEPAVLAEAFEKEAAAAVCPASLQPQMRFSVNYRETRAQALLGEGLQALEKQSVSFTLLCEEAYDTAMRRYLQTWQRVFGISLSVELETVSAQELLSRVNKGEYDIAFAPVRAELYAPAAYFGKLAAYSGYADEDFAAAVEALRYAEGDGKAAQKTAESMLINAAVFLPVWQESTSFLAGPGVSGVKLLSGPDRLYLFDAKKD